MIEYTPNDPAQEIPYGYCHCGCGQKTAISDRTVTRLGWKKGEPRRFILNHDKRIPLVIRFWEKVAVRGPNDCWEWLAGCNKAGYGTIGRSDGSTIASRTAYELTYGPVPDDVQVCHTCDNPPCCNPAHLFPGTMAVNVQDRHAKGRDPHPDGSKSYLAKLTEEQVRDIRLRRKMGGITVRELSNEYKVSIGTIKDILRRRTWKHI